MTYDNTGQDWGQPPPTSWQQCHHAPTSLRHCHFSRPTLMFNQPTPLHSPPCPSMEAKKQDRQGGLDDHKETFFLKGHWLTKKYKAERCTQCGENHWRTEALCTCSIFIYHRPLATALTQQKKEEAAFCLAKYLAMLSKTLRESSREWSQKSWCCKLFWLQILGTLKLSFAIKVCVIKVVKVCMFKLSGNIVVIPLVYNVTAIL